MSLGMYQLWHSLVQP